MLSTGMCIRVRDCSQTGEIYGRVEPFTEERFRRVGFWRAGRVMIGRAIFAVAALLAVPGLPWQASGQEPPPTIRAGEHRVPFQARDGLIYIHARVNGSPRVLLIDTGAMLTIFTIKAVPTLECGLSRYDPSGKGKCVGFSSSSWVGAGRRRTLQNGIVPFD